MEVGLEMYWSLQSRDWITSTTQTQQEISHLRKFVLMWKGIDLLN